MDTIETKHLIIVFIPTVLAFMFHLGRDIEMFFIQISSLMPLTLLADHLK